MKVLSLGYPFAFFYESEIARRYPVAFFYESEIARRYPVAFFHESEIAPGPLGRTALGALGYRSAIPTAPKHRHRPLTQQTKKMLK